MFTSIDKALVALIMGLLYIANQFGLDIGLSEQTVTLLVGLATPIFVYLVPNKKTQSLPVLTEDEALDLAERRTGVRPTSIPRR